MAQQGVSPENPKIQNAIIADVQAASAPSGTKGEVISMQATGGGFELYNGTADTDPLIGEYVESAAQAPYVFPVDARPYFSNGLFIKAINVPAAGHVMYTTGSSYGR